MKKIKYYATYYVNGKEYYCYERKQIETLEENFKLLDWIKIIQKAVKYGVRFKNGRKEFDIPGIFIDVRVDENGNFYLYYILDIANEGELPMQEYNESWFIKGD